jgi:hypothetical protein
MLTHDGTDDEIAAFEELASRVAAAFADAESPIALKVCEVLSAHILLQTYPQHRRTVMDQYFAHIRVRVFGDA